MNYARPLAALAGLLLCADIGVAQIDARMLRMPAVSATQVAFVYAGDIWLVPKEGGLAVRATSAPGEESFPRFSPDGRSLAFTADYDGNDEVYVMPTAGGLARRITHHPAPDRVLGWYPDGKSILIASLRESGRTRFNQLYRVSERGGMLVKLPVAYGEFGAISPDGRWLAYVPQSQDLRTWKRYRGGWHSRIWLYDFQSGASREIVASDANSSQPMWHGSTLYFLSDRGTNERANIWAYDVAKDSVRQVTHIDDYDVHFPSIGPTEIVFESGGRLYLLDLATEKTREVKVQVVTDYISLEPRPDSVGDRIAKWWVSPTGQRAIFEARGDVFTVPAENGPVLDLTRTPGIAERMPTWSPDGKLVAYWSDRSGEYELVVRAADGTGPEEQLTDLGAGFRYTPYWSPDSKRLAFIDQTGTIWVIDRSTKQLSRVDKFLSQPGEDQLEGFTPSWSADSRWIAYSRDVANWNNALFLYDVTTGKSTQVTAGYNNEVSPVFDPDGKYLYALTNRMDAPLYSDLEGTWIYANTTNIAAVPLRVGVPSPIGPRDDEEPAKADSSAGGGANKSADTAKKGAPASQKPPAPVSIDLTGFESRLVILPPANGNYADLQATSGKVVYRRLPRTGSADKDSTLFFWDIKERKEDTVLSGASTARATFDGKKVLVKRGKRFAILDLKSGVKFEKPLRTTEMTLVVDPRAEWQQLFTDAWRFERDFFYDPGMHGVDWNAVRVDYAKLLANSVTRYDVNFVIGEMISELSSSHTYRGGGDLPPEPRRGVGMLGADFALQNGAYRITHIVEGASWDDEVRSPLREPAVNVREGDYLLAVDGAPIDTSQDVWAAFDGLAGKTVRLTVNSGPTMAGARTVLVTTLASESRLRNLEWIESNRRRVDSATHGLVGYAYVPSTGIDGQTDLVRQLLAQYDKVGLIVDERFNSGGQIPDRFIEMLNRPPLGFYASRNGRAFPVPGAGHFGPEVMLINGWSGSGGDAFPDFFRRAKLGPLIGERTWGGLIGLSGSPDLIDGGEVTVPTFRQFDPQGTWFAEGHGVDPDIQVVQDPAVLAKGEDQQLAAAIKEVMHEIETRGTVIPKHPPYQKRIAPKE